MLRIFKAMANQTRIRMMELLLSKGEQGIEEISTRLNIPEATACRNLKILERVSLIKSHIYGGHVFYRIDSSLELLYNPFILEILKKHSKQ